MEYGEAISSKAKERALEIATRELLAGRTDIRAIAAKAVAEAYCVCVVAGEDAAEGQLSPIHLDLIEQIQAHLTRCNASESN